jgi:hypothetical protein
MGIATAIIGSAIVGGVMSSRAQKSAAKTASGAQTRAAEQSIAEQRRQFDAVQQLMAPYVQSGTTALSRYNALTGLSGEEAQQTLINQITSGAEYGSLVRQGEEAILQSASATGGLRGGNTQSALARFRPEILSSLIRDEYSRLGGMVSMGQNAAAGVGNAGMQTGQTFPTNTARSARHRQAPRSHAVRPRRICGAILQGLSALQQGWAGLGACRAHQRRAPDHCTQALWSGVAC